MVLVALTVFSLKRSTVGGFVFHCYLYGVKNLLSHAHKAAPWYLSGVVFKISDEHSCPFDMGVRPLG